MSYTSPPPMWQEKRRNQVKSKFYYIFWGLMSASVVAGQIYVGTGYREMSESIRSAIQIGHPLASPRKH